MSRVASTKAEGPYPYFGQKQLVNAPLDFGPYDGFTKRSFPGDKPVANPEQLMTVFFSNMNGEKVPLLVLPSDTVSSLRQRIWQKMHGAIKLLELEDDIDGRISKAVWGGKGAKHSEVADIEIDKPLAGNAHYSREELIEEESHPTQRAIRKKAPCPPGYTPPLRTAQNGGELEMYVGLIKIEDGLAPPLSQTINTGAMPRFVEANLTEAGITEGCVIRVEYTMMAFEVQDKRLSRGSLPDVETLASRVTETVLDPDWYVAALESTPTALMQFLGVTNPARNESGKCGSNCERANLPHIGQLIPITDRPSDTKTYRSTYRSTQPIHGYGTALRSEPVVVQAVLRASVPTARQSIPGQRPASGTPKGYALESRMV